MTPPQDAVGAQGPLLGIDVGTVRVGVAASDARGVLAVPVTTVRRGGGDVAAIARLARERGATGLVVGLPLTLSGQEGPAAQAIRAFAVRVARRVAPTPVRLVDERLTTAGASRGLRDAGLSTKQARHVVDQVAAAAILQGGLDMSRSAGAPVGELVEAPPTRTTTQTDDTDETRT